MAGTWGLWAGSSSLIRAEVEGDTESRTENTLSAILECLLEGRGLEGRLAHQQGVHDAAQGPDIGREAENIVLILS